MLLLKYDLNGTLVWSKTWGGSNYDSGSDLAVGPDGSIYVTGYTYSYSSGECDIFVLKLRNTAPTLVENITNAIVVNVYWVLLIASYATLVLVFVYSVKSRL